MLRGRFFVDTVYITSAA